MLVAVGRTESLELELSVNFCDDETIRVMSRDYRGMDKPTDVLAFSLREGPTGKIHPEQLGDVVVSLETAKRQKKTTLLAEVSLLAAHGLCHLLGYDHQNAAQTKEMNERIKKILTESTRRGRIQAA